MKKVKIRIGETLSKSKVTIGNEEVIFSKMDISVVGDEITKVTLEILSPFIEKIELEACNNGESIWNRPHVVPPPNPESFLRGA